MTRSENARLLHPSKVITATSVRNSPKPSDSVSLTHELNDTFHTALLHRLLCSLFFSVQRKNIQKKSTPIRKRSFVLVSNRYALSLTYVATHTFMYLASYPFSQGNSNNMLRIQAYFLFYLPYFLLRFKRNKSFMLYKIHSQKRIQL